MKDNDSSAEARRILDSLDVDVSIPQTSFRPYALYIQKLDRIKVQVCDRKFRREKVRNNDHLVFLADRTYVGFTIERAKEFCDRRNIAFDGSVELDVLVDELVLAFPESSEDVDEAREMLDALDDLTVRFD